jgi:muramoyltetrapeptide carboxypeptidase
MKSLFPPKLHAGDEIRVVAPSRSMSIITQETQQNANQRFSQLGLKLTFGKHIHESDDFASTSIEARVDDLHAAFRDQNVKAVFTVIGGFNSNQLLDSLDWELIKMNPKILCGYSDITALQNAIYARTGLVTYSGPHYSYFGDRKSFDYALEYLKKCLFSDQPFGITPSEQWSDDRWFVNQVEREFIDNPGYLVINQGRAQGKILGGNLCTFNLLQGTAYFPAFDQDVVLFIEDDYDSQPVDFDRDLQSLIHQPGFEYIRGIVIGRFQKKSQMTNDLLYQIIRSKKKLQDMPVLANADFGHTTPMFTFPIGGTVAIASGSDSSITFLEH